MILLSLAFGPVTLICRASMTVQSLNGVVTTTEISSYKTFMASRTPPTGQTYDNTLADGNAGMDCESLGLMYEVTNDPVMLNEMILFADAFLALRNNTNTGSIMWTGSRDPVWLTKPATNSDGTVNIQAGYAGCENNDIVGHIAFCARLILQSPWLWNATVPDGDPYTNGATYFKRAQTYIAQMDFTQDAYMLKWFVNANYQIVAPASAAWTAENENVNAYNRQMMFLNGFQRLSECHQLLGDSPARVTEYDAIVVAAINTFTAALQPYTTNGFPVYNWTYAPGSGGSEDNTLHSTYDVWGITRAWESGRYALSNATLVPFANTLRYVMNVSTNHISYYVNGTSSPNSPRNFIYPGWLPAANFGSMAYAIMANMDIAQGSQGSTPIYDALILWAKNARATGVYPTNDNTADFTISTPWMQSTAAGSDLTATVIVNPLAGYTGTVTLSAGHLPKGVAAGFNPASITGGSGVSTLTLAVSNSATGGIYSLTNGLTLLGTSSMGTRTAPITLVVKPHPVIVHTSLAGTNIMVSGTNGFIGATYHLLGSTNLTRPLSQWTPLATNVFGTNGNFSVTNKIPTGAAWNFFTVQY
ncbi:MAG: hypothetical protein P4N60_15690 [Verrucomicrobiae bacterium]|nr:hypothetical protein [Verrucomicrobiae bacterium]